MNRRNAITAIGSSAFFGAAMAQEFPSKPIRLVIGYPPGGGSDNMARQLGGELSQRLGQPVIVDNRPGANTIIASQHVATAVADGYTLFHVDTSTLALNQFLYKSLNFDPVQDFTPIAQTTYNRIGLLVSSESEFNSVKDVVSAAKKKVVNIASAGTGNITHITLELFKRHANVDLTHVPYRGSAPAMQELMSGLVHGYFVDVPSAMPYIQSGRLKLLGVMAPQRLESLPAVPTFAEAGYPDFTVVAWFGVVGPKNMHPGLVKRLESAIIDAASGSKMRDWMKSQAFEPNPLGASAFSQKIHADASKYGKLIRETGIRIE